MCAKLVYAFLRDMCAHIVDRCCITSIQKHHTCNADVLACTWHILSLQYHDARRDLHALRGQLTSALSDISAQQAELQVSQAEAKRLFEAVHDLQTKHKRKKEEVQAIQAQVSGLHVETL